MCLNFDGLNVFRCASILQAVCFGCCPTSCENGVRGNDELAKGV